MGDAMAATKSAICRGGGVILGLGIGASTAAFSIADAVHSAAAAGSLGAQLMRVEENSSKRAMFGMPAKDYLRWRDRRDLF